MKILVGGCRCGRIRYEIKEKPWFGFACHCTDCQTLSGSAFRTVIPAPDHSFRILSGEPAIYVKTGESGAKRPQGFCPRCGSPIYSTAVGDGPKSYFIRVGTVRQRDQLVPKTQIWSRSRRHWATDIGSIRTIDKQ